MPHSTTFKAYVTNLTTTTAVDVGVSFRETSAIEETAPIPAGAARPIVLAGNGVLQSIGALQIVAGFLFPETRDERPFRFDPRVRIASDLYNRGLVEGFASKFRPLVMTHEVKLLHAAPWGPHP